MWHWRYLLGGILFIASVQGGLGALAVSDGSLTFWLLAAAATISGIAGTICFAIPTTRVT